MRYFLFVISFFVVFSEVVSQNYDDYFTEKALRIDYVFSGDANSQYVFLSKLNELPQWAGRRNNLSKLKWAGNGQITVTNKASGDCIYKDAFSTLFQEWQTTDEAKSIKKSFENSFLIPYPKGTSIVEISLRDQKGIYNTVLRHEVNPSDILITKKQQNILPNYYYLHKGDDPQKCINVVVVAEGYTKAEMNKFKEHAQTACQEILSYKPFDNYKNRFNFIAVETVSNDSGVSVPREDKWRSTAFSSHFDTFYSARYLTTSNITQLHDHLIGIPYAHIIILANTDVYGGGGIFNSYTLTTTGHPDFKPVVVHEFGHSFAGLGDEYYYDNDTFSDTYPLSVEPWEPNITTLVDFKSKWASLLEKGTPVPTNVNLSGKYPLGVFEGAGYSSKGIYRPAIDCRMKTNTCKEFCPACQSAIEHLIKFYTE